MEKVWNQRECDYLKKFKYSWQSPRPKHQKADRIEQEKFIKNLPLKVKGLEKKYPEAEIDLCFFDEHRVGLKPISRKAWSPIEKRFKAIVKHHYEWLYVYGFANPKTEETFWYLIPKVNTKWLSVVYESFARDVGISQKKVLLVADNAGWHRSEKKRKFPTDLKSNFFQHILPNYNLRGDFRH